MSQIITRFRKGAIKSRVFVFKDSDSRAIKADALPNKPDEVPDEQILRRHVAGRQLRHASPQHQVLTILTHHDATWN